MEKKDILDDNTFIWDDEPFSPEVVLADMTEEEIAERFFELFGEEI